MGFYGNITNTSKTNFVFDRIYSNRSAMENNAATDGVFIGRYVLIEYGTKTPDSFIRAYGPDGDGWYYTSPNKEAITRIYYTNSISDITDTNIYSGMIIYIQEDQKYKYLICTGGNTTNNKPRFEETNVDTDLYYYNKNQDAKYQNSRGYDGTVWVKTSVEENGEAIIKYVNIAELNTVVPTFDIAYDAPTLYPITPHFDTDSNNVYYKLHMQPQWGLKIKKAAADRNSSDGKMYSSDETVSYTTQQYNPATDENEEKTENYSGAIYYNKTGFNVENSSSVGGTNIISIMPTGKSGQEYNTHDDNYSVEKQIDTQEIIIQLPTIGNTISKVWDIIYDTTNVQNGRRFRDIEWKYTNDADKNGDNTLGGMTRNLSTVAGCINSVHDLMGMIVYNGRPDLATNPDNTLIYFDNGKYYRIGIQYDTEVATEVHDGIDYFVDTDDQSVFTSGTKWNNEVKTIPEGVHLVTRIEEPCWIEMDLGESLNTIHGWILQLSKYFCDDVDNLTRNRETVQGTINYLNDIIDKFDKLVPGEFVVVDEYGRMQSAGYTTQQVYTSTNYGQSIEGTGSDAHPLTEDRWIDVDIDTRHENPFITITHNFTPVENNTTTTSDKNNPEDKDGINNNTNDELYLYAPIVDSMGHVVGKNIETVTLPYGYKYFQTNGLSTAKGDIYSTNVKGDGTTETKTTNGIENDVEAHNTQDTLSINPANKWIQTKLVETPTGTDELTIAHEIHSIDVRDSNSGDNESSHSNANKEEGAAQEDNLTIYDWSYDEAGHITSKRKHTYTLPFSYKTVEVVNSTGNGAAPKSTTTKNNNDTTTTTQAAETTQDTLSFKATNKWITMEAVDGDIINFGHVLSPETVKEHKSTDTSIANFGDSFNVLNFDTDEAGHITRVGQTTITTPVGTFSDTASSNNANVITSVAYTPSTGAIEVTHQDAGTLKLGEAYTPNKNGALTFDGGNTINDALSAIQTHINESEYTESGTQYFIDSITQVDGKIATTRKGVAGTLIVGYDTTNKLIGKDDSVNTAFDTIDKAIAKEVSDRIAAVTAEATTRANADTTEKNAREAADTAEKNAREAADNAEKLAREAGDQAERAALNAAIELEVTNRDNAINDAIAGLVDSAPDNLNTLQKIVKWIDADEDGAIDLAANVAKNAEDIGLLNTNLKSAAYETKETFVLKTEYDTKVASLEAIILDLTNRIIALETKMEENHPTETPTPDEGETI